MSMQIETYEIEEIKNSDASTMAADSEALEICRKLGLEGQLKLSDPSTDTRFQYPKVTAVQKLVYQTLFPQTTRLEQFESGIIPLRVLQVAAWCKDQPMIHHCVVWHTLDVKKDPILVGCTREYDGDEFLLARWGDALESFEDLQKKAATIIAAKIKSIVKEGIAKLNARMESADEDAQTAALTGNISWPVIYL